MARRSPDRVHSISTLPRSQAADRDERTRAYVISMTIRTLCFLASGLFIAVIPWTPGVWICIAAAAVLPYPAVVIANARDKRTNTADSAFVDPRALGSGPHHPAP